MWKKSRQICAKDEVGCCLWRTPFLDCVKVPILESLLEKLNAVSGWVEMLTIEVRQRSLVTRF